MRIVIDLQSCQNGSRLRGIGRYAMAMTAALLKVGADHEFIIALSDRFPGTIGPIRKALAQLIAQNRIVVFHLPPEVSSADPAHAWTSRAAEALREHFLASLRPDLVFIPSLFEGFWDDCVTSIGRQPIATAVTVHDLIPLVWPNDYVTSTEDRATYNRKLLSLQRADLWLTVSEFSRREACELLDLATDRVVNTSEAVGNAFRPASMSADEAQVVRERFGLPRPFVMFTSAIERRKNVGALIKAFGRLPPDVRRGHQLALVGSADQEMRTRLPQLAREAGLQGHEVVLTGHVTDQELIALYNLCQVFVLPSFHEGFGLPLLEAMACGAAVIGSNVSSIPEVVGRPEALFDPNDPGEMATLLSRVLTDETFRATLRRHGLARARTFSWTASAGRALAAFEALHAARATSAPEATPRRPRLAYVSSLPPLATAAARRAAALLPGLARHYDIELVSDQPRVNASWLQANFPVRSLAWFAANAGAFDRIVFDLDGFSEDGVALMSSHPGVVLLDGLRRTPAGQEPGDDGLRRLYEAHGWDAVAAGHARGRAHALASYPLILDELAMAGGVVALSESVRREAQVWLGDAIVSEWRCDPLIEAGGRVAAERLAEAIEAFALDGPAARKARLIADISAECSVSPSEQDLVAVAGALAANTPPAGRRQLLVDITAQVKLSGRRKDRQDALQQVARLVRDDGFGRRVEPVYADGDRFRYARAFVLEALDVAHLSLSDDEVEVFAGDALLTFGAPVGSAALTALHDHGVKILCLLSDAPRPHLWTFDSAARATVRTWIEQAAAASMQGAMWAPPTTFATVTEASATTPRTRADSPDAGRAFEPLKRLWDDGVLVDALLVTEQPPLIEALRLQAGPSAALEDHVRRLDIDAVADGENALFAAARRAARQEPSAKGGFNYIVRGHVLGAYSLALINRATALALERHSPGQVKFDPVENGRVASLQGVPAAEREAIQMLTTRTLPSANPTVVLSQHYPVIAPEGDRDLSLALVAWEESLAPTAMIENLSHGFDAVLATSGFTAKALIDSGLSLAVVSIGQAPGIAEFAALPRHGPRKGEPFTFLHVSSVMARKGVDVLLAAWRQAFRRGDSVRLIIKTFPNPHNDVAKQVADLRGQHPECAEIQLVDVEIDQAALLALYGGADAVVSPSRGEGYNLPVLEAMVAGIPVIVTGYGGHRDFCGPEEARLLKYRMARSASHVGPQHALWAEPDADDLVAAMRELVDPTQGAAVVARADRARVRALAAASAERWARRLETLAANLMDRTPAGEPRIAWVSTWDVRCGIAEYSRLLLDHVRPATRASMVVICDRRTPAGQAGGIKAAPAWTIGMPDAWLPIAEQIEQARPDVVVIQHQDGLLPWDQLTALLADARLTGRVSIVLLHNATQLHERSKAEAHAAVRGLRLATRVLVHSLADVNLLLDLGLEDNVTLFPHGAARAPHTPLIRDCSAPGCAPVIGCHGFFLPGKGIEAVIRACAELRKTWPGLRLRLVNARFPDAVSDHLIAECRRLADELGIAEAIEWRTEFAMVGQVVELLQGCDLILMAYDERTDSASGAVRTALSSLAPVAVTPVAIFSELCDAVAWLPSNEPVAMARSVAALLRDTRRRRDIQARAAEWLDGHRWAELSARLQGMINGLVATAGVSTDDRTTPDLRGSERDVAPSSVSSPPRKHGSLMPASIGEPDRAATR